MEDKKKRKPKRLDEDDEPKPKKNKGKEITEPTTELEVAWDEIELLSQIQNVPQRVAQQFVNLLNEGCTLPFIARYRKTNVDNLMPDQLQELYESYQNVSQLKKKIKTVLETLRTSKKLTPDIQKSILNVQSLNELDLIYAPLKTSTLSLAEKARKLGLECHALKALNGDFVDINKLCSSAEELSTAEKVDAHITHIVADIIYKDTRVMEEMRLLKDKCRFTLQSTLNKNCLKAKDKKEIKKPDSKSDPETYKIYFDWKCPTQFVKPHQMLALNRGEDEKILSVKVVIPDWYYNNLERFCKSLWKSSYWVKKGLEDAYKRLIKPWLSRQVCSELTKIAEKEAVKTFTNNLEKYLLTEPVKNRRIVGLDPGFTAGCKVGVIDTDGQALETFTIHPQLRQFHPNDTAAKQLRSVLEKHGVEVIGLGNGTACRETEKWLQEHQLSKNIPIVIVPEQGASIYSVSKEAQKEHSKMDPNLISALSIARRVLDPLGELIKVDPKNLGVGLYQHDIPAKMLGAALDCCVEKVVSLVGADVNTASHALLRRISGLNDNRAKKLIEYRNTKGKFGSREEILKVTGIGKVTYQQCAGFLKVLDGKYVLDSTIIHPESYAVAQTFAKKIGLNIKDLNKPDFPAKVEQKICNLNLEVIAKELKTDICAMEIIVNAFKQKNNEDNLITFSKPVYSLAVTHSGQLEEGMTLTGVVRNVVPFGCFVDCGVGDNGLIHRSKLSGNQTPKLGDRVRVTIIAPPQPKKLQLKLDEILQ